jgi:hypothetical protein
MRTTPARAATVYDAQAGSWPVAARPMYNAPKTSTTSAATATQAGRAAVRPWPGRVAGASAVARPHLKQMMALSEISIPQ